MSVDENDQWLTEVLASDQTNATRTLIQGIVDKLRFDPQVLDDPTWLQATADSFRAFAVSTPTGY